jgi:cation diffusion facilitator CzcD-associated flavoprotein CzcO
MTEHVDVIVVGAGISGIGAAVQLQKHCPDRRFLILEGRAQIGGTWDLFRYPGIRSDSDMYTLGFNFKPWTGAKAIADGPSILRYLDETAREYGVYPHIRFRHRVQAADWDSATARWSVRVDGPQGNVQMSCNFLYMCSGYYRYDAGYTPDFPGREHFRGPIVHPQHWPRDLDYRGKRVVVIGSGATAMTLVPSMAADAAHVTMLQRSPTYVISRPAEDRFANRLRGLLGERAAYWLVRWRNVLLQQYVFWRARTRPAGVRDWLLRQVRARLGPDYDVATHFTPRYNPWEQRLCLVPDDDLFRAINSGKASVVTDHIECFTAAGIRLQSGRELEADIIVTATGLELLFLAGLQTTVDGRRIDYSQTLGYKGVMFSGVPNLAAAFGYTNASWTLKADLGSEYVCRLLNHLRDTGTAIATPLPSDPQMATEDWIDFSSGYFRRALHTFPKQGTRVPWKLFQNYARDIRLFRYGPIDDGELRFTRAGEIVAAAGSGSKEAARAA